MLILKRIPIPEEKDNGNCISFRACEVGGEQESSKRAAEEQQKSSKRDGWPGLTACQASRVTSRDWWPGVTGEQAWRVTKREPGGNQDGTKQHSTNTHPQHNPTPTTLTHNTPRTTSNIRHTSHIKRHPAHPHTRGAEEGHATENRWIGKKWACSVEKPQGRFVVIGGRTNGHASDTHQRRNSTVAT